MDIGVRLNIVMLCIWEVVNFYKIGQIDRIVAMQKNKK